MKPFFSIIVPVYRAERTLSRCVDSVLDQAVGDFEIILVDDGSPDGSGAICHRYAASDGRIRVIHQQNAGVSAARNCGIEHAAGQYILFLDSDDALEPGALDRYLEASENGVQDVVIGGLSVIENGVPTGKIGMDRSVRAGHEIWEQISRDPAIFGYAGGKMVRTDLIRAHQIRFNTAMRSQEDLDFFLSAYGCCGSFCLISETVYRYYYAPATRTPPFWDFIANQMKMLRIGSARTALSDQARACVQKRILNLLYTGLHEASARDDYRDTAARLARVEGLEELLRSVSVGGEEGFVARNFAAGRYSKIQYYFRIRNKFRDMVRMIRNRKPE